MSQGTRAVEGGHGHAVVIGSGLAGLTAARALANFMDRVTVIERDRLPRGFGRRRGVPQARHTHTLMPPAQQGLERLFPGIVAELTAAGAVPVGMPRDMLLLGPAGWLPRFDAGLSLLSAGRDLIDAVVRERLRTDPKVTFLQEHEVVALEPGRQDTVAGVWTRGRDRQADGGWGPRHLLSADFVVDATGRGSRAPRWLAELGYPTPRESAVQTPTTYASTVFTPPIGHVADFSSLLLMGTPDHPRQGVLHPVEGGRWSVTLSAGDGSRPPADHEAMLRAAGELRHPLLREIIEAATPLGPVYACARTENRWRHYEKLRRWPDQFLVVGDAFVALDPAHGHGMTLAVQSALVLDHVLAGHGTAVGITFRLRHALARHLAPHWAASERSLCAAGAGPHPRADGLRARLGRLRTARIAAAATTDEDAARLLLDRLHTFAPPTAGLRPRELRAVLRAPRPSPLAAPPSTTHGQGARRRLLTPAAPGLSLGSGHPRSAISSAQRSGTAG
ncbi:NAD(P)/FAD-dependent oxidoreductase [Streptomyces sp. Ru71]|uniref:FAD-dependent oxidoreductase n=1 Tax=Streptomyces sp. Ru71 TaxID=2080746 RepID=UPI0015E29A8E|nr:FAD-dependent monooxygenase [Streptomyces sp. Ru71]